MIVCSCNLIRCTDVRGSIAPDGSGPRTAGEFYGCHGCRPICGRCAPTIRSLLVETRAACLSRCADCPTPELACKASAALRLERALEALRQPMYRRRLTKPQPVLALPDPRTGTVRP